MTNFKNVNNGKIMNIYFLCTYWGKDTLSPEDFTQKVISADYNGMEVNPPSDLDFINRLRNQVERHKLLLVAQQWLPPKNERFSDYRHRYLQQLELLASLNPLFINSHTGKDFFSFEDNCILLEDTFEFSEKTGIKIVHETHRGRFAYSAKVTLPYLEKYPELALNADLSHWCTVSESLLEDQQETLKKALDHANYIHARVGHTQSPQIPNPFDPEWTLYLETFTTWWEKIIKHQLSKNTEKFYICPEAGPWPYMPWQVGTQTPAADQWSLNLQMRNYLEERFKLIM